MPRQPRQPKEPKPAKPKPVMRWVEALKVYNTGKMWCVPRKGSSEYEAVKAIMYGKKEEAKEEAKEEVKEEEEKPTAKEIVSEMYKDWDNNQAQIKSVLNQTDAIIKQANIYLDKKEYEKMGTFKKDILDSIVFVKGVIRTHHSYDSRGLRVPYIIGVLDNRISRSLIGRDKQVVKTLPDKIKKQILSFKPYDIYDWLHTNEKLFDIKEGDDPQEMYAKKYEDEKKQLLESYNKEEWKSLPSKDKRYFYEKALNYYEINADDMPEPYKKGYKLFCKDKRCKSNKDTK